MTKKHERKPTGPRRDAEAAALVVEGTRDKQQKRWPPTEFPFEAWTVRNGHTVLLTFVAGSRAPWEGGKPGPWFYQSEPGPWYPEARIFPWSEQAEQLRVKEALTASFSGASKPQGTRDKQQKTWSEQAEQLRVKEALTPSFSGASKPQGTRHIVKYQIAYDEKTVNSLLVDGWEPFSAPFCGVAASGFMRPAFTQVMVLYGC